MLCDMLVLSSVFEVISFFHIPLPASFSAAGGRQSRHTTEATSLFILQPYFPLVIHWNYSLVFYRSKIVNPFRNFHFRVIIFEEFERFILNHVWHQRDVNWHVSGWQYVYWAMIYVSASSSSNYGHCFSDEKRGMKGAFEIRKKLRKRYPRWREMHCHWVYCSCIWYIKGDLVDAWFAEENVTLVVWAI